MNFYDVIFAQQKTKTDNKYFSEISDAINVLAGTETTYNPAEMAPAIIGAIPDVTVTDSIVSVTDAAAYPAEELEFAIEPVQDLHGYDNPWPAGGGKNLCSGMEQGTLNWDGRKQASAARIRTSNFYKLQAGQPYTFSTNALVSGKSVRFSYQYWETDSFEDNTRIYDSSWVGSSASFTPSRNCYFTATCGYLDEDNITPSEITTQLELGSTATSYEPYSNICPISGWTGVNGRGTAVNVWDEEWELGGLIWTTGQPVVAIDRIRSENYCPCRPSTTYYAKSPNGMIYGFWYDSEKNYIGYDLADNANLLTTPANAAYFKIVNTGITSVNHDISINYPATDTEYHAYQGTSIPITFPTEAGTVYGGKVDVVNGKLLVYPEYDSYNGETLTGKWISDRDVYVAGTTPTIGAQVVDLSGVGTEYDLTPQQVQMLLGDNNVWCDTGDTTLEYKVDLGRYIAKLQAAQATPQLSLSRQAVSLDAEPITQEIKADVSERNSAETEEQEEQRQEGDAD